ncbi:MAG: hypothetical protein J0I09_07830 [Sphingobacteriia bacterium]|nr:hypothetical protein [Sphingobacteriia bacterium]
MFNLFGKKADRFTISPLWQKIGERINAYARRSANWLNIRAAKLGRRKMMFLLVVFCLYWSSASMYIILRSFQQKDTPVKVTAITVPKTVSSPIVPSQDTSLQNAITRITHFKSWLDSLRRNGDPRYAHFLKEHPGLFDSITFVEQYYSLKK